MVPLESKLEVVRVRFPADSLPSHSPGWVCVPLAANVSYLSFVPQQQHCPPPGTPPAPSTPSLSRCPWPTSPTRQTWPCPACPARKCSTPGNASSPPRSWSRSRWSRRHARSSSPRTWRWAAALSRVRTFGLDCWGESDPEAHKLYHFILTPLIDTDIFTL